VKNRDILIDMFSLQQKLNDDTNGKGWESGYNKHNRIIDWGRCIYMECAELIDSFNWKHWKDINIEPDWENIKIEIVDIWHFVMSLGLEQYHNKKLGSIKDIVKYILDSDNFKQFSSISKNTPHDDNFETIKSIEDLIRDILNNNDFHKISNSFFTIASKCGLNVDLLYKLYISKNILNQFRQDNGYKEGTYKKNWNGKEDNDIMLEIMDKEEISAKKLYKLLNEEYLKVVKS